jgi:hypothetical protein
MGCCCVVGGDVGDAAPASGCLDVFGVQYNIKQSVSSVFEKTLPGIENQGPAELQSDALPRAKEPVIDITLYNTVCK